jgi:alpha-1,3-rhamnosyl/mannosyltransferase
MTGSLRVCIDATPLLLRSAGVKTYIHHWLRALALTAEGRRLEAFPWIGVLPPLDHQGSGYRLLGTGARLAALYLANIKGSPALNWIAGKPDVFHATNQVRNPPSKTRLTATLHDLTCWVMPEVHTWENVLSDRRFSERVLRQADALIAVSDQTRQDAERYLGLPAERIEVIYSGVNPAYYSPAEHVVQDVRTRLRLSRQYVLFVGTIEPRKNLDAALDAYLALPAPDREEFEFIIAGPRGWAAPRTLARLKTPPEGVRYLGYVPERDLPGLTAGATVFFYPSLYEGFGFPVAQAMAAGVPVVTSNVSALPEITAGAALLVDPRSEAEMRSALERILCAPSFRAELAEAGRRRAAQFSWEECARRTWRFFERVAQ